MTLSRITRSERLFEQASELIPWGAQTGAKAPAGLSRLRGSVPLYMVRGKGSHVWDPDGNEYIDYRAALGPIILGYSDPDVDQAVKSRIDRGTLFSMSCPDEIDLASLLKECVPCAENSRFLKTGGDANSAAVRIARAYTGRDRIASSGYHGWHDTFKAAGSEEGSGIPAVLKDYIFTFGYNDLAAATEIMDALGDQIACIIANPFEGSDPPAPGYLQGLADLAHKKGALLIFDEVKTGFRLALGGAQERYRVTPDLAVFSKAMANGYPISAFVGRKDVMRVMEIDQASPSRVNVTTTFAGDAIGISAAIATISKLRESETFAHIEKVGAALMEGIDLLLAKYGIPGTVSGLPSWFDVSLHPFAGASADEVYSTFYKGLLDRGIFCTGDWHVSYSHSVSDVDATLEAVDGALGDVTGVES